MQLLFRAQAVLRQISLAIACAFLFLIMLLGGADALSSNLLNAPIPVVLELSEVLLATSVFLALASAGAARKHIIVDVFVERMSERGRTFCQGLGLAVGAVVLAIMAWRGWGLAADSVAARETAAALIPFPVWPAKLLAVAGMMLATSQCLLDLVALLRGKQH